MIDFKEDSFQILNTDTLEPIADYSGIGNVTVESEMDGLKDNYGAEIGMRVTCQRCGMTTFRKQTGYNSVDAAIQNRHSFYDQFEPVPSGREKKHDLGGWLCPECMRKYNQMIENFKVSR